MPVNDFLPFGTDTGANVLAQSDYEGLVERQVGFQAGVARSERLNKVWRQSSVMASMIGAFIVEQGAVDARDDADLDTLLAHFVTAIQTAASAGGGGSSLADWQAKNANYTAYAGDRIMVDVSGGPWTLKLPAAPTSLHTEIWVKGNCATNNLTIDGNGHSFDLGGFGVQPTLTLNKDNVLAIITFDQNSHWRL